MKNLFFLFVLVSFSISLGAQKDSIGRNEKLIAILQPTANSIMLRWAPSDAGLWLKMHRAKIVVERSSWKPRQFKGELPELISDTIRVWDDGKFDSWKENELVMLAGYCIHAPYESLTKEGKSLSRLADQEQELANRFSSALYAAERDVNAAKAQALYFEDQSVDLSMRAIYNIKMYVDDIIYVASVYYDPQDKYMIKPEISKWTEEEGVVVLSWDKKIHEAYFSAYYVERSKDGRIYQRLTEKPYVHAFDMNLEESQGDFVYIDSVQNYIAHHYRIVGLDAFGQESAPSESRVLMGRDRTPPKTAAETSAIMHRDQFMKVRWDANDKNVSQVLIKKSYAYDGTYTTISNKLTPSDTIFFDLAPNYLGSNFYKVCVYDTARNEACTFPIYGDLNDTIPPAPPTGMVGSIDTNGVVKFSWNRNKEVDLRGYKIFFANRYDGVYSVLTNEFVRDTFFMDTITLNTLTENIFYRVVAADVRDNVSNFSKFTQLKKPDILPPGPSVFSSFEAVEDYISISWKPSETRDVVAQHLYRKSEKESDWKELTSFDRKTSSYKDYTLEPNMFYQYRIIAEDDSGLLSKSARDIQVQSPLRPIFEKVELSYSDEDGNRMGKISSIGGLENIDKIVLYREMKGMNITHEVLKNSDLPFMFIAGENKYTIRVFYKDGQKSAIYSSLSE